MTRSKSPLEITEREQFWLLSREVSESPKVGGDQYYTEHQVTRPEDVTLDDLPPANKTVVREIDKEALDQQKTIGKWQVPGTPERVEELWPELVADAEKGIIWAVKAMTTYGYEHLPIYDDYLLTVYTPKLLRTPRCQQSYKSLEGRIQYHSRTLLQAGYLHRQGDHKRLNRRIRPLCACTVCRIKSTVLILGVPNLWPQ